MAYWVQIELDPTGHQTGWLQLDLEKVQRVQVLKENRQLVKIGLLYENETFHMEALGAGYFLEYWKKFLEQKEIGGLHAIAPEQSPSIIEVAGNHKNALNPLKN